MILKLETGHLNEKTVVIGRRDIKFTDTIHTRTFIYANDKYEINYSTTNIAF